MFIFELVTNEMLSDLTNKMKDFSDEIFQKIIDYSVWETSWYIDNQVKGRFISSIPILLIQSEHDGLVNFSCAEEFKKKALLVGKVNTLFFIIPPNCSGLTRLVTIRRHNQNVVTLESLLEFKQYH